MYQIIEYARYNPNASPIEVVQHFENTMEIPKHLEALNREVEQVTELRKKVRPLYAKRMDVEELMKYALSDIEMEIMIEYPPRKGSDAQREAMRNQLKQEHADFKKLQAEFKQYTEEIQDVEDELKLVDMGAKAARRVTEMFGSYVAFITEFYKQR